MNAFAALGDSTRREIVEMLAKQGELSVADISKNFSISSPAVSQHLKVLRDAHVIQMKKSAQQRLYSLDDSGISEVGDWLIEIKKVWNKRLDSLDDYLHKMDKRKRKK